MESHRPSASSADRPAARRRGARLLTLAAATTMLATAPAYAGTPDGNGLRTLTADCAGLGTIELVASSGNAVWIGGVRHLARSVEIDGRTQEFGVKAGFTGTPVTCVVHGARSLPATFLPAPGA